MTAEAAIELSRLTFSYTSPGPNIVHIAEMRVAKGKRVFLHGPSGSGKTTLLGLIAGILEPKSGSVTVLNQDLARLSGAARDRFRGAHCGYIFQMFNLLPYLEVRENIALACKMNAHRLQKVQSDGGLGHHVEALASALHIQDLLDRKVTDLSVGQQQRVATARALIGAPELVIADEPTSALDFDHREAFLKLLFDQAAKTSTTVLFVSHDHTLKGLFDDVISLRDINQPTGGARV